MAGHIHEVDTYMKLCSAKLKSFRRPRRDCCSVIHCRQFYKIVSKVEYFEKCQKIDFSGSFWAMDIGHLH